MLQSQIIINEEPKAYATQHSEEVGLLPLRDRRYNVLNARGTNSRILTLRRKFSVIAVKQMGHVILECATSRRNEYTN